MAIFDIKYFPSQALRISVSSHTADFTAENGKLHLINPTLALLDVQLPAPFANTHIWLKDMSGDTGNKTINIVRNGTELIDGVASNIILDSDKATIQLVSDGVDWYII
jgi:hypothetical protein